MSANWWDESPLVRIEGRNVFLADGAVLTLPEQAVVEWRKTSWFLTAAGDDRSLIVHPGYRGMAQGIEWLRERAALVAGGQV